ncbi:MAG TPA: hypothetical protein VK774_05440 [Solirubrobacteraceae bacterium]|nr:hypothetical protein [Solirubrobacteraceae bacterium]
MPTPSPLTAGVDADVLELLEEDELLLPHAASPTLSTAVAHSAATLPLRILELLHRVSGIRFLLVCGLS